MSEAAVDKFKRIRTLRCYEYVEDMLYAGFPPSAVADYIQTRMHEYRDVKKTSLIEMLKRYRDSLKDAGLVCSTLPRAFVKAEKNFTNKMKELERLEDMYQAQQYRFDVAHGNERISGFLDPVVDKIEKGMRDIAMSMHRIKMDLGLVGSRDLGTITVTAQDEEYIKNKYGDGAAKAFADPVSRGRVLAALGALKRAGDLRNKDGSPLRIAEHMDLSEDERAQIIDIEPEESEEEEGAVEEESEPGVEHHPPVKKAPRKKPSDFMPEGEDFSAPADDMDESVEALDVEDEPETESEEAPVASAPKAPEVVMEPVRRPTAPNLPPPPMKPSVRGNPEDRWTTRKKK